MALTAIDDYEVMYSSTPFVPRIWLISQGNFIGQLIFMPDGSPLPGDTPGNLYYHLEDFETSSGFWQPTSPPTFSMWAPAQGTRTASSRRPSQSGKGSAFSPSLA